MIRLSSYVQDQWVEGTGEHSVLVNPSTEEALAETSTAGIDMAAAITHARDVGGPALRAMTFAQRGELLKQMANALHEHREELLDIAERNNGGTRGTRSSTSTAPPGHWPATPALVRSWETRPSSWTAK